MSRCGFPIWAREDDSAPSLVVPWKNSDPISQVFGNLLQVIDSRRLQANDALQKQTCYDLRL